MASAAEKHLPDRNWTLMRSGRVCLHGAEESKPYQKQGRGSCLQSVVAAPEVFILSHVVAEMDGRCEHVSRKARHPKQGRCEAEGG